MTAARVAKLEALLARVQSRRLAPGLRLVDAPVDVAAAPLSAPSAAAAPMPDQDDDLLTSPPPAPTSALLTLDEPIAAMPAPAAPSPVLSDSSTARITMELQPVDELVELADAGPAAPTPPAAPVAVELPVAPAAEPEDALVTAVARPAPTLDEPTFVAPSPAHAHAPVAEVAAPAAPAAPPSSGPVIMSPPPPVASGPVATFLGAAPRTEALSFGELVGLAMSLTTR